MSKAIGTFAVSGSVAAWCAYLILESDVIVTDPMNPHANWALGYVVFLVLFGGLAIGAIFGVIGCIVGWTRLLDSAVGFVTSVIALCIVFPLILMLMPFFL